MKKFSSLKQLEFKIIEYALDKGLLFEDVGFNDDNYCIIMDCNEFVDNFLSRFKFKGDMKVNIISAPISSEGIILCWISSRSLKKYLNEKSK